MKYDPKSSHAEEFISHEEIEETLAYGEANRANRAYRTRGACRICGAHRCAGTNRANRSYWPHRTGRRCS